MFINSQQAIISLLKHGFSEQKIADKTRISQASVHKIKSGTVRNPRVDTAEKIENLYLKVVGHS